MKYKLPFIAGLIFTALMLLSYLARYSAIDFTENRAFSLSETSIKTINALKEPIKIEYFHSQTAAAENPPMHAQIMKIRQILRKLEKASGGKIEYAEFETDIWSEEQIRALKSGLVPLRENENKLSPIYSGIIVRNKNHSVSVPLIDANASAEFEILSAILRLSPENDKIIGIISSLDWLFPSQMNESAAAPQIAQEIVKNYSPEVFASNQWSQIPNDIKMLFIAQPNAINETQTKAIADFINRGGNMFICADPASNISRDNRLGIEKYDQSLSKIFHHFGLNINGEIVMDKANALRIRTTENGNSEIVPQPLFFAANWQENDGNVNLATSGYIEISPKAEFNYKTLLSTSNQTSKISADAALIAPDPAQLIREFESKDSSLPLAVFVSPKEKGIGSLLLIADCDFLSDGLYLSEAAKAAENADLILNSFDILNDTPELSELRNKNTQTRPLKLIEKIKSDGENKIAVQESILNQKIEILTQYHGNSLSEMETKSREIEEAKAELRKIQQSVRHDVQSFKNWLILICGFVFPFGFLASGLYIYRRRYDAHNS